MKPTVKIATTRTPDGDEMTLLMNCNFNVRRFRVPAHNGSKSQSRFVWVASEDKSILPPGGRAPRLPLNNRSRGSLRRLGR